MLYQPIRQFWIDKIKNQIVALSVDPTTLDQGADWESKLNGIVNSVDVIENYGRSIFKDVFDKAGRMVPNLLITPAENYDKVLKDSIFEMEQKYFELVEVYQNRIGVDPTNPTLATDASGNNIIINGDIIPKWKYKINEIISEPRTRLTDIPVGSDLETLLYHDKLYEEIVNELPDLISQNLAVPVQPDFFNYKWPWEVNAVEVNNLKGIRSNYDSVNDNLTKIDNELGILNAGSVDSSIVRDLKVLKGGVRSIYDKLLINPNRDYLPKNWAARLVNIRELKAREAQIKAICGLNATDPMPPSSWVSDFIKCRKFFLNDLKIADLSNLPTIPAGEDLQTLLDYKTNHTCTSPCTLTHCPAPNIHTLYNSVKAESDEYWRIYNKLSGKVSDNELQTLLDAIPTCPHTDYDTIKSERDTLKTENTQLKEHQCDCESKVAEKEKEIITKIITDLSLSTERERENVLEAVITEIKNKITPPSDSSKESKITELETEITKLKAPKSLSDLPISKEVKEEVIKISQELGLTKEYQTKLESAKSYQELSTLQQQAFQEKLNSEVDSRKSSVYLNYGLGALTLGSLLILAYILVKRTKNDFSGIGGKEKKE